MSSPAPTRRGVLTGAAALAAAGYAAPASPTATTARTGTSNHSARLTILGTTDLHGNVFNWDYYKNAEYDDAAHNDIGIAKVQTLIKAQRERLKGQPLLMLDAGDTIQGTPLAYYYAKVEPITSGGIHPMAKAMNLIGYDAAALGNHEFNYGIPLLRTFESQLTFPLLGANAVDPATKRPVFPPYIVKRSGCRRVRTSRSASSGYQPRHRDLGPRQRLGQDRVPGPGRAGEGLRARS